MGDKKKKCEECAKGAPGWIVSFADLMTLLFAAFVVLYALKTDGIGESTKIEVNTSAIREAFAEVSDDIPIDKTSLPISNGKAVFQYIRAQLITPRIITKFRRSEQVFNILDKDLKKIKELIKMIISQPKKESKGKAAAVSVHREDDGIRMRLLASHFFRPGEYRMDRKALRKLDKVGDMLKSIGRRVSIEGHTDSSPNQGKYSKWELSALRATHVVRYFVDTVGFPSGKIRAAGYGDAKPLATNDTAEGRKLNRRIEIKIHYDGK